MSEINFDLTGKTALVTGSSRGIGRAIALALAANGAKVIFHGVKPSDHLAAAVALAGNAAESVTADLGNADEVKNLLAELEARQLAVDILVLNSSVQSYMGIGNFAEIEFARQMATNVESAFLLLQALAPKMGERRWGRIVGVSSINQLRPAPRLALYGATKGALSNLIKSAAKEFAPLGVTANTIVPGVITTDRNAEVLKNEEFAESLKADIPMHRFGTPDECAGLVAYLVSDTASYVTGAEIPIAGGWQL